MDVRIGKFIIRSDAYCMWIDEEYTGKTRGGEEKLYTRQVAGYVRNFEQLLENFLEKRMRGSDARDVEAVLKEFAKCEGELRGLIKGMKKK